MQPRAGSRDLTNDVTHEAQANGWPDKAGTPTTIGKAAKAEEDLYS